jgi:hypothetical protein
MVTTATTTATSCTYSVAAAVWGYLRLNPRPPAPIGALLCMSLVAPAVRKERQSDHENEAKRSRVRGLRASAHLRRRPARRPVGCGGGAPALRLIDHSQPPPQCGNGRERLPPLTAHRRMRPLHDLQPGRVSEAGARVQASIEGFEPTFSTCSDARS